MKVSNYPDFSKMWPEKTTVEEMALIQKLFFLAAHDIAFFGTYDPVKSKEEGNHVWGKDAHIYLNMSDTFYYACADSENFEEKDVDLLIDLYTKFGHDGLVAWASIERGETPLEERQSDKFKEALKWINGKQ